MSINRLFYYTQKELIMPQSLSKVYTHIVFSTKYRADLIDEEIQERLFNYLGGICKGLDCNPVKIGGHKDHVHILCLLSRKISQATLLETIKRDSSKWIKTIDPKYYNFYWQNGYGIFSVSSKGVASVVKYIEKQKAHHSQRRYKEEYRILLEKNEIVCDEQYVWE